MNKTEFENLLSSYGANLSRWPEAQRDAAMSALAIHLDWQTQITEEKRLDDLLDGYTVDSSMLAALERQILNKAIFRRTVLDKLLDWVSPAHGLWKPALAACLPILVGLSIGLSVDVGEQYSLENELTLTGLEAASWETQDE